MHLSLRLGQIWIFPIKSLDGSEVSEISIAQGGYLANDREYAIFDADGRVVNGKRTARIHALRSEFDPFFKEVRLWEDSTPMQFCLDSTDSINRWLSDFFGFAVALRRDTEKGFPDDRTAFGPTIVSEASLKAVHEWFPELSVESIRRRFRANLELTGGDPFCEDCLYGAPEQLLDFQIGEVRFRGHNPCQRCVVPTRHPESGEALPGFQKKFMELRRQHLPKWAHAGRFNHYYRFAVNTSILEAEAGKKLHVGDSVFV